MQAASNEFFEPSRVDSWERRKPPLLDSLVEEVLCFSFKMGFPLTKFVRRAYGRRPRLGYTDT